jgi:hypothetical protein
MLPRRRVLYGLALTVEDKVPDTVAGTQLNQGGVREGRASDRRFENGHAQC